MYTEAYDIDMFLIDKNDNIVFIASGGGDLPFTINELDCDILKEYFINSPNIGDYEVSNNLKSILGEFNEKTLFEFTSLSKKGIYSFDKTKLNDSGDLNYHLVSIPEAKINLNSLPTKIQNILSTNKLNVNVKDKYSINLFSDL